MKRAEVERHRAETEKLKLENEKLRIEIRQQLIETALKIGAQLPQLSEAAKADFVVKVLPALEGVALNELTLIEGKKGEGQANIEEG